MNARKKKMRNHKKISKKARKITNGAASVLLGAGMMTGAVKPVKIVGSRDDEITEVVSASVLGTEKSEVRTGTEQKTIDSETQVAGDSAVAQETSVTEPVETEEVKTETPTEEAQLTAETATSDEIKNGEEKPAGETEEAKKTELTGEEKTGDTEADKTENKDGEGTGDTENPEENKDSEDADKKTDDTQDTKKASQINIKDFYGDDGKVDATKLSNYLKEVADKHPLGIAGIFHIFAEEVDSKSHIAGNIAADKITAHDFATDPTAESNLTIGDIHYIGNVADFNQFSNTANKIVILGPNITFEKNADSNRVTITDANGKKKELLNVSLNNVISANDLDFKVNIEEELNSLGDKFDKIAEKHKEENKLDFTGVHSDYKVIDISKMEKNEDGSIYINIDAKDLSEGVLTIKNIEQNGSNIIINVKTESGTESLVIDSQTKLHYVGMNDNEYLGNTNKHDQANKLLWIFGSDIKNIEFKDTLMGSVLATGAEIKTEHNIDGNIVVKKLTTKGETHRWDLVPPVEIEIPDKPTPEDPKPEDPKDPDPEDPEDPKDPTPTPDPTPDPTPTPDPEPTPEPEEPDPLPEEEPGSEYPDQPEFDEEEAVPPHAEAVEEDEKETVAPHAEVMANEVTPNESEGVTNESTEVVESSETEETLPETGDKNNEVAGALGAMAAALGITGLTVASRRRKVTVKREKEDKKNRK